MKLSKNLPQFKDTPALIISCGWQSADFYLVLDGEISKVKKVKTEDHKYSDKEGYFVERVKGVVGKIIRSGSVLERKKDHIRQEFLSQFFNYIKKAVDEFKVKEIYLFSPSRGLSEIVEKMPSYICKLIKGTYTGNYSHYNPDKLVELLIKKKPGSVVLTSEEADKILKRVVQR